MSHFLLTIELSDLIKNSCGRVINICSVLHHTGSVNFKEVSYKCYDKENINNSLTVSLDLVKDYRA